MEGINIWAVLVAAVSSFALGGLWYGPLFQKVWCREAGVDPTKGGHPVKVFGGAFVFSLLSAYAFSKALLSASASSRRASASTVCSPTEVSSRG